MFCNYINKVCSRRALVGLIVGATLAGAAVTGIAHARDALDAKVTAPVAQEDLLAGDTWHAMAPSWPGTIRFDGTTKKVVLEPLGSNVIEGDYAISGIEKSGNVTTGKLIMTSSGGSVSESTFTITGKDLKLAFAAGNQTETYKRMTIKEAEAEKARLLKALREGRTRMIDSASLQK